MEHWVEVNLQCRLKDQDAILLEVLRPYAMGLDRDGRLLTWHYLREPELRFRVRLKSRSAIKKEKRSLANIARKLKAKGVVSEWNFGSHGEKGRRYSGEVDRYGEEGWKVTQGYLRHGSEVALALIELRRGNRLENPLWGKGLGNPWEGGTRNPWRGKVGDPLEFHWSRFVHLFSNQLGFDMLKEAKLSARQAKTYRAVHDEIGMDW
jgi:hypothetical protein